MDAITLLKDDHRRVKKLFADYKKAGKRAYKTKAKLSEEIIRELSVHSQIEEQIFYPSVRDAAGETEDMVLESLEEHHIVKWTLDEIEKTDPTDERFDPKVTVLIENVTHHIKEEEEDLFKRVRAKVDRGRLRELGEQMARLKEVAPTRPHPMAPDTPPGNVVAAPAAALMDAGKDLVSAGRDAVKSVVPRGRSRARTRR